MDVLVDYYNLSQRHRQRARQHGHRRIVDVVIDRIVSAIVPEHVDSGDERIDLRLYGGWYEDEAPTRDAQEIDAALTANYPTAIPGAPGRRIVLDVQLAYSLKCDPEHHLFYTLRSKAAPRGIEFLDPTALGCTLPDRCPLRPGYDFFVRGRCPEHSCTVSEHLVVRRREQKLVDTMLAADVFFNVHTRMPRIAVVSSDDDLWPAIRTALQLEVDVVHIHTERRYATRAEYLHGGGARYVQLNLQEGKSDTR